MFSSYTHMIAAPIQHISLNMLDLLFCSLSGGDWFNWGFWSDKLGIWVFRFVSFRRNLDGCCYPVLDFLCFPGDSYKIYISFKTENTSASSYECLDESPDRWIEQCFTDPADMQFSPDDMYASWSSIFLVQSYVYNNLIALFLLLSDFSGASDVHIDITSKLYWFFTNSLYFLLCPPYVITPRSLLSV